MYKLIIIISLYYKLLSSDGIPSDGTPTKIFSGVHVAITVILDMFAIAGIIFAIVCLLFNVAFRKRKCVT